jgi:predicted ATPase
VTIALRLLGEVSYAGDPIAGARPADLLAALAASRSGVSDQRLVDEIWVDEPPAVPGKALQVLVSRVRTQLGPDVVARNDGGYRLGLAAPEVDVWVLDGLVADAARCLADGHPARALPLAEAADGLLRGAGDTTGEGALARLRRTAGRHAGEVRRLRGLALHRTGEDAAAAPALRAAHHDDPDDVEVLDALLRSEAATAGVPTALARYDTYRRDLAGRLGVDPDPALQRLHRELLAADEPVRTGVRYDADELLGRDADLAGLRPLVRTGRLTTILGPGGLGKTRIAHVLAREATQPRVHVVELVGVAASEDVVSEVGSALGVRNSVTGRRGLTPAQVSDVRGRIAQELDTVPTLLVLDNCEHVLDAAASLVAFLLATTRDLRIVTTSRAPLGIAAERVFGLSQLAAEDAVELFCRRARAVRPDAHLPEDVVAEVVARLDGLPLAVELAAARIRTMSVDEVRRALADRLALLRGRDRSAPARHQTLTSVIGWSWDLLSPEEQRALAWLSVFHDGLSATAACVVLGPAGPDLVEALVDQSLLTVSEDHDVTRYRMLETVREYAGQRLAEEGTVDEARAAQTRWAVDLATRLRPEVFGPGQIGAMDVLSAEEGNLSDVLRRCLLAGDAAHAVPLLATEGALWSITGNHPRFFALADLAEQVLVDWDPPPELTQVTLEAIGLLVVHVGFLRPDGVTDLAAAMARLGEPEQPWTRVVHALFAPGVATTDRVAAALSLADDPDPRTALMAWQWAAVLAENQGEIESARSYVEKALDSITEVTTPWQVATLHTQLAMLDFNAGRHHEAAEHARIAVPILERLHADEDALSMRTSLALAALEDGDLDGAERLLAESGEPRVQDLTGGMVQQQVRAALLLARGDVPGALDAYAACVESMRAVRFAGVESSGLEPWVVVALGAALTAHVRHGATAAQQERAVALTSDAVRVVTALLTGPEGAVDYPVTGMVLAALGARVLTTAVSDAEREAGCRLLALAVAFGYNRWFPVMAWEPLAAYAEKAAPGRLAEMLDDYGSRRGHELHAEALAALAAGGVTSSG